MVQYRPRRHDDSALVACIVVLAQQRQRFGWRRLVIMTRREGFVVGERAFRRIYRANALQVKVRRKRHVRLARGTARVAATVPNECWAMDFVHDRLATDRTFRVMDIVDTFSREGLAAEARFSFASIDVIAILDELALLRGYPKMIRIDHGTEFTSRAMLRWAADHNIILDFIDPGKPTQNGHAESFNGRVRDELLNQHNFATIVDAQEAARAWLDDYNDVRPHSALGYLTPREFAARFLITPASRFQAA